MPPCLQVNIFAVKSRSGPIYRMGRLVTQVPPGCQALVDDYLIGADGRLQVGLPVPVPGIGTGTGTGPADP
jgi:hypothetical protein